MGEEEDEAWQVYAREQQQLFAEVQEVDAKLVYLNPYQVGSSDYHDDEVDDHVNAVQDGSSETLSYTDAVL